jgi:predicted NUDIX family phosphoesterase
MNEQVMVVERERLAPYLVEFGLVRERLDEMLEVITSTHFFLDRPTAESSPQYKQIIPYVVIRHADLFFLLQRTPKQTETRLHNMLSIGVGGHINPDTPDILEGLRKELEEEVEVEGDYDLTFAGILNDDTTEVGRVHLGMVYVLDAHDTNVMVRETEKMVGRWADGAEVGRVRETLETWSRIVFDALVGRAPGLRVAE